jgi:translation initiation factor 1
MAKLCSVCGLPEELCACKEIAVEQQRIVISSDKRRYGKEMTIVEGIDTTDIDINDLARSLKTKCATGGSVKDGKILLQGDQKKKVEKVLKDMGFSVEVVKGTM